MSANLFTSLIITGIGMGLVFGAIILLMGIISAIVRILSDRQSQNSHASTSTHEERLKAAIAAVSVALAIENQPELHSFPLPPTAIVSAWQAVMRSEMLKKRSRQR